MTAPAQHEISTGWVDVPVPGDTQSPTMPVYLARPARPGAHPSVIVGFEMFGVTGYVRGVADRIARLGYTAAVPDFYHRLGDRIELPATPEGRDRGLALLTEMHRDGVLRDVRALLRHLHGTEDGARTAMVGLSAGGHLAYYVATTLPLAAVAVLYPGWLTDTGIALSRPEPTLTLTAGIAAAGTPLLFLVGDGDHLFTAGQRDRIAAELRGAGVRHEFVVYPDTPHGFFCQERDSYRPAAAADAFGRITALLAAELPAVP